MEVRRAQSSDSDIDSPSASARLEDDEGDLPEDRNLKIGESFESIEAFEQRLREVQDETFCAYYRRDAVTVAQCRKRGVKKHISENLKYYMLVYCCIHGGKKFKSLSTGQRSSATFQKQCDASFKLTLSENGNALVVSSANFQHNHQCSKTLYKHLPQTRRLKPEDRHKVADLLNLDANRKKVKARIEMETNKVVLLKDLSNIAARGGNLNNLATTVKMLEEEYAAECHVYEEENVFKGLFFTTKSMKVAMKAYPEFVGIDATFKLLNIRAPVYLMVVEDSEGCTEIVAGCILISEDKESMTWFLQCFKQAHPSWHRIKCVMADKDLLERTVIKTSFPSANVLICIFHSLRTFNREITCDKLGITPGQRDSAKEIFQKMVYSKTIQEYDALYETLKELPRTIIDYFNDNWHPIRDEWTLGPNFMRSNFLNTTNNRIESLNAKVKSLVKRYSSLEDFVKNFFILVACLHTERDHKAAYAYQKTTVVNFAKDSPEFYYSQLLTGYSFQFVKLELSRRSTVRIEQGPTEEGVFITRVQEKKFKTASGTCDCTPHTSMNLPCRHIFALREKLAITLQDDTICDKRWTRDYYYRNQRVFETDTSEQPPDTRPHHTITSAAAVSKRILSQHEKFRKAAVIAKEIASLASEATGRLFVQRMEVLADIKKAWQENREVYVTGNRERQETSGSESEFEREPDRSEPVCLEEDPYGPSTSTAQNVGSIKKVPVISSLGKKPSQARKDLTEIVVPPAQKQKGRPKGAEKTIIGLPKRSRQGTSLKKLPFCKLRESHKVCIMLRWFVDDAIAEAAVSGKIIDETDVEARFDQVTYAVLDEDVNIELIKRFFSQDGWNIVKGVLAAKRQNPQWECGRCLIDLEDTIIDDNLGLNKSNFDDKITIRCDYCLMWYHLPCVSLKRSPKSKFWMCSNCRD